MKKFKMVLNSIALAAIAMLALAGCPQDAAEEPQETAKKAAAPFITEQPTDYQPSLHEVVTLNVAASVSDGGSLSFQWYSANAVGAAGTGIAGATECRGRGGNVA